MSVKFHNDPSSFQQHHPTEQELINGKILQGPDKVKEVKGAQWGQLTRGSCSGHVGRQAQFCQFFQCMKSQKFWLVNKFPIFIDQKGILKYLNII